jgi:uncharacterized protein
MAVISCRPRLLLSELLLLAVLSACSLMQPAESVGDKQAHAQHLAAEGKHADAARAYAELATASPAESDNYQLLSAEQWVIAGDAAAAKQSLARVSPEARTKLPASRALVAAQIALADNDGASAIRELDTIAVPTQAELAQNYWWVRGKASFMTGHPQEGTRAFVERERYLTDPASLHASREELFSLIRVAAERGQSLKAPPNADPIVAGWLALGPVAVDMSRNPMRAPAALAAWKRAYPQHPANDAVLSMAQTQIAVATTYPDQIALLLPLSGRAEAVGVAVRDGFIAAYLEQDPATRPHLRIYDVAAEGVPAAYHHAVEDGAGFVVGPLTKEDVAAIAPLSGHTPLLALNFLADGATPPQDFYQFALSPEDEARNVARRLVADGKLKGVAIIPAGDWGNRVAAAFAEELSQHGGGLLDVGRYESGRADFSDIIKQVLQVHGIKGEPSTHRADATFVFLASTSPGAARLIVPQLKFNFAGDVPAYSTSDSFEPDPAANADLDGLSFPDMPWMVSDDPVTAQIRDSVRAAWPSRTARRDRLYAFGFDAYRLVPALRSKTLSQSSGIAGVTGKLILEDHNRVHRELEWVQIRGGVPAVL